jgi:hypothetical protein
MFVDRVAELALLNRVLARQQHPGSGQLVMLYGRRRLGKPRCSGTGPRRVRFRSRTGLLNKRQPACNGARCTRG